MRGIDLKSCDSAGAAKNDRQRLSIEAVGLPDARFASQVLPIIQRLAQAIARAESGDSQHAKSRLLPAE